MKKFIQRASKSVVPSAGKSTPTTATPSNPSASLNSGLQPKFLVPPVPHPCPWDHIAVLATDDCLLLKPHFTSTSNDAPMSYVRIPYAAKGVEVEELSSSSLLGSDDLSVDWSESIVVYGIVGILELFTCSYLLVISSRLEVGKHLDPNYVVYCLKAVTPIPLTLEKAKIAINTLASHNINLTHSSLPTQTFASDDITPSPIVDNSPAPDSTPATPRVQFATQNDVRIITPTTPVDLDHPSSTVYSEEGAATSSLRSSMSDISDSDATPPLAKTIAERLSFWTRLPKRSQDAETGKPSIQQLDESAATTPPSTEQVDALLRDESPSEALRDILKSTAPEPVSPEERHSELEDKVLKEVIREFVKGGMYFAYTFDITRSLQHKKDLIQRSHKQNGILSDLNALGSSENLATHGPGKSSAAVLAEPNPTLPLWRRVDRHFWWNEWLSKPFIDAGLHSYVLPIMQGYYQMAQFTVPPDPHISDAEIPVDYIVVSRRSRARAGLRYQRRGIDDEAHVANFVETETLVHVKRDEFDNIFSYVQIRGSIPLFWTQTGYGIKPPPVISTDRTHEQTMDVMRKHFARSVSRYGPHQCVNLAEQQGREAAVTEGYRKAAAELGNSDVKYHEYDFHVETKGMKYENISKLIATMEKTFSKQGYLWVANGATLTEQNGVYRTNCIDCLDRTNVVQSAFARFVLNKQLSAVGLVNVTLEGEKRGLIDSVFNDVWANNGDAISRAYAGTSALKGDFTRTGKRDLTGMLNDGVNSLARMYTSTFSDWFSQAVIDFMLGSRTISVFSEFLLKLQSSDPRDLIRLSKIRAEAIATSVSRVLPEGERLLSGWTLFAPEELDVRIADKFEEKVLLLTAAAIYIVRYDYTLEKVKVYTRVPLGDLTSIQKGAYIISPLEETSRDPLQNAGFLLSWVTEHQTTRVGSYSIRNSLESFTPKSSVTATALAASRIVSPQAAINAVSMARSRLSTLGKSTLSEVLANTNPPANSNTSFAAFKVLPIDPGRTRRASSSDGGGDYIEGADTLAAASNCLEAAGLIVECIQQACSDIGNAREDFVISQDVMSLADAQRSTTIYAKMEYGVKRLLWLGAS